VTNALLRLQLPENETNLLEQVLASLSFGASNLADPEAADVLTVKAIQEELIKCGVGSSAAGIAMTLRKALKEHFWSNTGVCFSSHS
jgi:hypothetical protein